MWRLRRLIMTECTSLADEDFASLVYRDISRFLQEYSSRCCLVFPPLNNHYRYLIHKVGELFALSTFSVGEGTGGRMTVVCSELAFCGRYSYDPTQMINPNDIVVTDTGVGVEAGAGVGVGVEAGAGAGAVAGAVPRTRRLRPDAPIYIPPAIRRAQNAVASVVQNDETQLQPSTSAGNDVNMNAMSNSVQLDKNNASPEEESKENSVIPEEESKGINASPEAEPKEISADSEIEPNDIYAELEEELKAISRISQLEGNMNLTDANIYQPPDIPIESATNEIPKQTVITKSIIETKEDRYKKDSDRVRDRDEEELLRASEEINRRNRIFMRQTYPHPNVLIITNPNDSTSEEESSNDDGTPDASVAVDNWEDLVDEKEISPDVVLEITKHVGEVTIVKTQENYKDYKEPITLEHFPHIVEIYGFPPEFKTRDFIGIFESFKCGKYHIKWVDDTHALGIFTSTFAVNEILKLDHPLVKIRPLSQASRQSYLKARDCSKISLLPAVRPQTCVQAARRLVTGALGLKLHNSSDERAKERELLKKAREKKRLSMKQQEDIWEGKVCSN